MKNFMELFGAKIDLAVVDYMDQHHLFVVFDQDSGEGVEENESDKRTKSDPYPWLALQGSPKATPCDSTRSSSAYWEGLR